MKKMQPLTILCDFHDIKESERFHGRLPGPAGIIRYPAQRLRFEAGEGSGAST